jgi:release factor glutamine methyltransferase
MRPAEVVRRGAAYLERHGVGSPEANAERLMLSILGIDRAELVRRRDGLTMAEARAYGRVLCRRCTGTPLQHLTGEQAFRHLVLTVRPGVFIPRPETEVVVDVALAAIDGGTAPSVVDVGTGTGAIGLSIAQEHPGARVWATDRSHEAVALARENAERLGLDVTVLEGELLEPLPAELRGSLDLVVANPPYVPPDRAPDLSPEVLADPADALFAGPELSGRILDTAAVWLRPEGHVVLEIDDEAADAVSGLARRSGFADVVVHEDLAGRPRVVAGRRP